MHQALRLQEGWLRPNACRISGARARVAERCRCERACVGRQKAFLRNTTARKHAHAHALHKAYDALPFRSVQNLYCKTFLSFPRAITLADYRSPKVTSAFLIMFAIE